MVNGTETVLKSVTVASPVAGQFFILGCQAQGTSLTLTLNGATKVSVTNAIASTGKVGMAVSYPVAGKRGQRGPPHRRLRRLGAVRPIEG